jgi:hypothetical protein
MLGRLFNNPTFQKAWLIATTLVGGLGILAGCFQFARNHPEGIAGIVGGAVMFSIGIAGLRSLKRRLLPPVPNAHR